jgi:hypothetical protein
MSASRKARGGVSFVMSRDAEQAEARRGIGLSIVLALVLAAFAIVGTLHAFAWILSGVAQHVR